MTTALTLYGLSTAATTIGQAGLLTATGGGATTATKTTLVGTSTGFGRIAAQGTTAAWPALNSLQSPAGGGFLFDVSTLENQQVLAGSWTPTIRMATSVGSVIADLYVRVYLYYNGTFWPASSTQGPNYAVLAGQTLTTSNTTYTLPATTFPQLSLLPGYKLYCDLWLNITTNSTGSGAATIGLLESNTSSGITNCQIVTPGYQPLTQSQLQALYTYGGFIIHNSMDVLLQDKTFDFPEKKETLFKIARNDGMKKTGEVVNEKRIAATISILGWNRPDVEAKWDAMQQALSYEQQNLVLHALDGRYWVADALTAPMKFSPGKLQRTPPIAVSFVAQSPYAYAAAALTSTDSGAASAVSGTTWQRTNIVLWRQGTTTAYPQIVVTNNTVSNNTTLTTGLTSGNSYTSLTVGALPHAALSGDTYTLNDGSGHTQNVTLSAGASGGATSISVTSFTANFSYPGSGATTVQRVTTITSATINDVTDGRAVTFAGITLATGQALTVLTDPTLTNGQTGTIAGGNPLNFSGIWPQMGQYQTSWTIQVSCQSQPTIQTVWTWTPRLLS